MIGKIASRYKIVKKLGEGGMGEVFLAEDIELHRTIAIKFLPAHLLKNSDITSRFKREAKAVAALNHSNIITIYDIGHHNNIPYIAMEYVPGFSLKDKIEQEDISPDQIIDISLQICNGLNEAHQAGIYHRDVKPDNILIDERGRLKIADFGLAKVRGQSQLTEEGSTLGTLNYMSPEQLRSGEVDQRSDIWSVGIILYEMITGRLPFTGDYREAVSYAILNDTPEPLARYKSNISDGWQHIIEKALDKDEETRYQNISDLMADIKREKKSNSVLTSAVETQKKKNLKNIVIYTVMVVGFLTLLIWQYQTLVSKKIDDTVSISHKQVSFTGNALYPAISPDGQFIAYTTINNKLMMHDLSGGQTLELYQSDHVNFPRWSPDGSELIFTAQKIEELPKVLLISRLGGNPRILGVGGYNCWAYNGTCVATVIGDIKQINLINKTTMESNKIPIHSIKWIRGIDWSDQAERFLLISGTESNAAMWILDPDDGSQHKLLELENTIISARWSNNGKSIFCFQSRNNITELLKYQLDNNEEINLGKTKILASGLEVGWYFTLSADDKNLVYTRDLQYSNLWLTDIIKKNKKNPPALKQLTEGTYSHFGPSFSPDGRWIAYAMGKYPQLNIYKIAVEGGNAIQLTYNNKSNQNPVWSPDGKLIAYGSNEGGSIKVWTMRSDGSNQKKYTETELSMNFEIAWTPDNQIFYQQPNIRNFNFLDPVSEIERPLLKNDSLGYLLFPAFSPDGKILAVYWNRVEYGFIEEPISESPTAKRGKHLAGLWYINLDDYSEIYIGDLNQYPIKWSLDGSKLYSYNDVNNSIETISRSGGESIQIFDIEGSCIGADINLINQKIVLSLQEKKSDVWLMQNFNPKEN